MTYRLLLKRFIIPLICVLITQIAFSQNKTVSGRITDDKGSPVVGATVALKGSTTAASTGTDGSFSLSVPTSARTLVISSVGFNTQEVNITDKTSVEVSLASQNTVLSDVVVVGYGTARRKDLTGSVGSVREKDFNKGIVTGADQLIQGKVAGVQVINNTGAPGGATTVRIRGISSIRSGNSPLFVVDGVPLSGGSAAPGLGTALGGAPGENPLNFINPSDIASIDVLKDASATAIFGSRGANGVVMITTKKGLMGAPRIDVTSSFGFSNLLKRIEVLDGDEYRAALTSYGLTGGNFGQNVDALKAILQTGLTTNNNISINGGNDNARYRISGSYLDQEGIVKESGFKKYTAAINSSFKFLDSKRLGLDFNVITSHTNTNAAPISNDAGFQGSLIGNALQWNPTHALRKANDSIWIVDPLLGNTTVNPLALLAAYDDLTDLTTVLASISPSFKITNDLEYKFLYSINYGIGSRRAEMRNWLNITGVEGKGFAQIANNRSVNQSVTNTLNYSKALTSKVYLNALIGYEYLKYDFRGSGMTGTQFVDYPGLKYTDYMQNAPASERTMYSFADPISELQSYFARANVNLLDKYLFTATIRSDGSSKFGENHKYGYFPSFAAAWNISSEDFLRGNSLINNLKLRVGWGQTGNQEFPSGASLRRVAIGQGVNQTVTNFENPDVKWETNTLANAGLDFTLLSNRISGSIDYYNRKTTDALFESNVASPGPPGGKFWENIPGEIVNSGVEIALNIGLMRKNGINWNVGGNVAFQKNEINDLVGFYETGGLHGQGISGATSQRLVSGQPIDVYYLRQFEGIDKTTGQSIYTNDGNTLFYSGSPNPKVVLGLTTDLTVKSWSFVVNMNGAFGHLLYNNTANSVLPIGNLGTRNIDASLIGGIKESTSNPLAPSTRYLEKGNYLKLANATISYRLGDVARVFRNANISLTGQNLFVITKFSGFDPEVNVDKSINGIPSLGIEYIPYPTARTVMLGVSFTL